MRRLREIGFFLARISHEKVEVLQPRLAQFWSGLEAATSGLARGGLVGDDGDRRALDRRQEKGKEKRVKEREKKEREKKEKGEKIGLI